MEFKYAMTLAELKKRTSKTTYKPVKFLSRNSTEVKNLTEEDFKEGTIDIISILVTSGLVKTRSEGRRAVEQGGVTVEGEKVTDFNKVFTKLWNCGII